MKTTPFALLLAAAAGCACAQTLAPELAPIAAKYKADIALLESQRAKALAQAQAPYTDALARVEKTATAAGNVAGVAVIVKERAALTNGLMTPGFPPGMPKELQGPRKTYLDAVTRIKSAEAPRRQSLDAAYLRALTGLGAKAAKDTALASQVEAEKQKLLASAPATGLTTQRGKSMVVNGTFEVVDSTGGPAGWIPQGEGFRISQDGSNSVLHASARMPVYAQVSQDILLPPRARTVTLTGRVRGKAVAFDAANSQGPPGAKIAAVFLDKSEEKTKNWIMLDGGYDEEWKTLTMTQKIPDDMKALHVQLVLKHVSGEFDFDDIVVEFR